MALPPEIETKGLKAYEQARAFERLRTWRLPVTYCVFVLLPVVMGFAAMAMRHFGIGAAQFGAAILIAVGVWVQWLRLERRYAQNVAVVAELEKTYGDQLPWVQMNQHFAELEKLREELAQEKQDEAS